MLLHAGTCLWVLRPFIWHTLSEHLLYAKLHIRLSLYHGDADFTQPFPTTVGISLGQRGCSFTHLFISLSLKIFPKCKVSVLAQSQGFSFWTGHCTEMFFFFFFSQKSCSLIVKWNVWPATVSVWGRLPTVSLDYVPGLASQDWADILILFSTVQAGQRQV